MLDISNNLQYSYSMNIQLFPIIGYGIERLQEISIPNEQLHFVKFSPSAAQYEAIDNPWCFAVDVDGKCVGYLNAEEDFEGDLYIRKFVIDQAHQHIGIGTAAIKQFIQMAQTSGTRFVMLSVAYQNQNAELFYKKLGFTNNELGLAEAGCKLLILPL